MEKWLCTEGRFFAYRVGVSVRRDSDMHMKGLVYNNKELCFGLGWVVSNGRKPPQCYNRPWPALYLKWQTPLYETK